MFTAVLRVLWIPVFCASALLAAPIQGRITDGRRALPGVRVFPDRQPRISPAGDPPVAVTDGEGRFRLDLDPDDAVLVVEKDGWSRDLVPAAAWTRDIVLHPQPAFRQEAVFLVRLDFTDEPSKLPDGALRELLFSRRPGVASAANYLYEVSKGALSLVEGRFLKMRSAEHPAPRRDEHKAAMARWVLERLQGETLGNCDRVNNRSGEPRPDGKPDHLWIITPGHPQSITADESHLKAVSLLAPLPWNQNQRWPLLFMTEEVPLGNIVHEAFHAMGEHRVDDLYLESGAALTAGIWDLMDGGQYRGWDRSHPDQGPWVEDTGYSPSHPLAWVRSELWYRGHFRPTIRHLSVRGRTWEGWLAPVSRAPGEDPQWLTLPDPRKKGRFFSLEVRRPWGFERGRIGHRFGPGHEGLVVATIDPGLLTYGDPRGPARVVDAHPNSPQPDRPRLPLRLWELDDAAFNLGPGENPKGRSGPLAWEVLETDASGRMRVRVNLDRR
ncbi:MAG TPA: carboxypeptidase-like regulatory domain-containing protein [Geothrix sp.]|nr:carboxypeptidase-like regulatory domain-containing protein [Geothrix sp.]